MCMCGENLVRENEKDPENGDTDTHTAAASDLKDEFNGRRVWRQRIKLMLQRKRRDG